MSIDPVMWSLGILSITNAIDRQATHTHTHCAPERQTIDTKELARHIVEEQESAKIEAELRQLRIEEKLKNDTAHQLDLYAMSHCSWDFENAPPKVKSLYQTILKDKPVVSYYANGCCKLPIFRPDKICNEFYVMLGKEKTVIEAKILQIYFDFFSEGQRMVWRELIDGQIYFVLRGHFIDKLGWSIE